MGLYLCRLLGAVPDAAEGGKADRSHGRTEQKDAVTETDKSDIKINLLTGKNIVIGFGSSTKVSAQINCDPQEADFITINWQKLENNVPVSLNLNTVKYSGSSIKLPTPELVINDAEQEDAGVYQLNVVSTTSTVTSEVVIVELHGDPVESIAKEERNFLRFWLLCQNLGSKAVLLYFNKHVPEPTLASHLNTHRKDLNYITGNRAWKCNKEQYNVLFPGSPAVAKSSEFDISLIYKLIRNTINVRPPAQGWGNTPLPGDISDEDDIERVRYYRNKLAHNTAFKIQDADFKPMWDDMSEALKRLSCNQIKSDIDSLKNKAMDNKTKSQAKENIKTIKQDVELLEEEIKIHDIKIQEIKRRLDNPIPENIQRGMERTIQTWTESDQVFYDQTRAYKAALEKVQSCQVVTLIGGPGSGKTATVRHIALEFKQNGWDVVPVCEISKVLEYAEQNKRQVFVIDDVLGVLSLDKTLWNVANSHKERIDQSLHCDSKLICTSRKQIYKESMGSSFSFFQNVVDLEAKENQLNENEMRYMLENHCVAKNVDISYYTNISTNRSPFMFPLLCYCFSTNPDYQAKGSRFFDKPHECMLEQLDVLCNLNPLQYSALVLCLLNDNNFCLEQVDLECKQSVYNTCGVNLLTSDKELKNALYQLAEVFLIETNGVFTFIHDSIYEIIGHHYGKENVGIMLKYMPRDFIWNKVTVGDDIIEDELSIKVNEKDFGSLVDLMFGDLSSINKSNLYRHFLSNDNKRDRYNPVNVLTGKSYKVLLRFEPFVDAFLKKLQTNPTHNVYRIFESSSLTIGHICRDCCCERFKPKISTRIKKNQFSLIKHFDELLLNYTSYYYKDNYCDQVDDDSPDVEDYSSNVKGILRDMLYEKSIQHRNYSIRLMSWVVYHNQSYFFSAIYDKAKSSYLLFDVIMGDKEEMLRLLILACFGGSLDIAKILLQHLGKSAVNNSLMDINPDRLPDAEHRRYTPFQAACTSDNLKLVKYLVTNEADLYSYGHDDLRPLHFASWTGHLNIVKYLIKVIETYQNECDFNVGNYMPIKKRDIINPLDKNGQSPLLIASKNGFKKIVKLLLDKGAEVNLCDNTNQSPMYQASRKGHTEIVKLLIDNGADVNVCNESNESPLQQASKEGHTEIVKLLIDNGAEVNLCDKSNESPLQQASKEGHTEIVKLLIDNGAEVNLCDKLNESPLQQASKEGHTEIVKLLIDNGADVNLYNALNGSPLHQASEEGHTEIVKLLIDNGAEVNLCDKLNNQPFYQALNRLDMLKCSPLHLASTVGHTEIVKVLLDKGAEVNLCYKVKGSPLHQASGEGHTEIVKLLIENAANVNLCNFSNESPLHKASLRGHIEIVKLLIENAAKVNLCNTLNESPLHKASLRGHIEIVKLLIENVAEVNLCNKLKESPLFQACRRWEAHREIVKLLIDKGAEVNLCDYLKESLLHKASSNGDTEIVKLLIDKGAKVNLCNSLNQSPLYQASMYGRVKIAKLLIAKGAKVNLCNSLNQSPLYQASMNGHYEIVKLLIDNGADVNLCNESNESPLHQASREGHTEIVKVLIDNGADVNLCNESNESPLHQASRKGHTEIVKLLIENAANVNICNTSNESPLHKASLRGHIEIVKLLIENVAEVNLCNKLKESPLFQACRRWEAHTERVEIAKLLIDKGAKVNLCNSLNQSPLYQASKNGHYEIVKLLIDEGAEVNLCYSFNGSPLCVALKERHAKIAKLLIANGAKVTLCDRLNRLPLHQASMTGHTEIVTLLFDKRDEVDLCDRLNSLLMHKASKRGHTEIVQLLIDNGTWVTLCDRLNRLTLHQASRGGHTEIIKSLVGKGADVNLCNNYNESPLCQASSRGYTEVVKFLVDKAAKVNLCNTSNESPLYKASLRGHIEIAKLLIEKGAEVNLRNKSKKSSLYQDCGQYGGHTKIVKLLLTKEPGLIFVSIQMLHRCTKHQRKDTPKM